MPLAQLSKTGGKHQVVLRIAIEATKKVSLMTERRKSSGNLTAYDQLSKPQKAAAISKEKKHHLYQTSAGNE